MFPESGYIVNESAKQYFKYANYQGEKIVKTLLTSKLWNISDTFYFGESLLDVADFIHDGFVNLADLRRPRSA